MHTGNTRGNTLRKMSQSDIQASYPQYLGLPRSEAQKYLSAVSEYPNTLFQSLDYGKGMHDSLPSLMLVLRTLSSEDTMPFDHLGTGKVPGNTVVSLMARK